MMRWIPAVLAACVAASAHLPAQAAEAGASAYVLYKDATLIDGTGAPPQGPASILVKGERIEKVWLGNTIAFKLPPGSQVVDASGLYVLPGLVNSHEHLATPPNRPFAEAQMKRDLYGGITAVRDMADDLRQVSDLARAARVGELPGPDIYYAALMAGPEFFDDPRTHAVSAGAVAGHTPWMQAIDARTDLRMAVALARGTGASAIKIYADLPAERVKAITAEAHRQGIPVWAHAAVFPAKPSDVIAARADAVSHVCMLAYEVSDPIPKAYHHRAPVDAARLGQGDNPVIGKLLARMKAQGTVLDATLFVYAGLDASHAAHPTGPQPYCTTEIAARLTDQARRAGVIISAGTDGFSEAADPYPALYQELELLVARAGFTPMQAILAATAGGARAVTANPDFGTIAAGQLANLMFTAKDPTGDIGALRTVVMTVKRGVIYRRADFNPQADAAQRKDD
ncbi:amidohydrolase family protein [Phenylobacterium aquaticum]|uniref:amidohydrolase family protein n=1 Tax=Phenylobacterium aquaticum TaxID=1763816 RepID=UPI0026F33AF7|nr:amidohydrolase family protein [Phenylobacterium aquaticum]